MTVVMLPRRLKIFRHVISQRMHQLHSGGGTRSSHCNPVSCNDVVTSQLMHCNRDRPIDKSRPGGGVNEEGDVKNQKL